MNKLRLAALQLELKKTDTISYLLSELNNLCSKVKPRQLEHFALNKY